MQEFLHRLHEATPRIYVTWTLIAVNLGGFALMALLGVSPLDPSAQELLALGGNFLPYTLEQPWRLASAMFLHGGILHIGFNMWALRDLGSIAERFYGNLQFLLIYLLSGIFGSLASLFFSAQHAVSVGASGAIFGVAGAVMAALYTKAHMMPTRLVKRLRAPMLVFLGFSLFLGFSTSFVDNSAHLGGLASGFVLAWMMAERFDREQFRRHAVARAGAAVVAAILAAGLLWRLVPQPGP